MRRGGCRAPGSECQSSGWGRANRFPVFTKVVGKKVVYEERYCAAWLVTAWIPFPYVHHETDMLFCCTLSQWDDSSCLLKAATASSIVPHNRQIQSMTRTRRKEKIAQSTTFAWVGRDDASATPVTSPCNLPYSPL